MTYQKVKEKLVETDKVMTSKQLIKFTIRLFLIVAAIGMMLGLLAVCTLGFGVAIFSLIGAILVYAWVFDMLVESPEITLKALKFTRIWPLCYILFLGEYVALKFFNFI